MSDLPIDARRAVRLRPMTWVTAEIENVLVTVELRDLSPKGFAIIAAKPFWMGMTHRFNFTIASGPALRIVAKAVHCYRQPDTGEPRFVTGWEFLKGNSERAVFEFVEAAAQLALEPAASGVH